MSQAKYDVVVAGAGPSGCVAALLYARQGAKVLLADAAPNACHRFAGEWIHPPGASTLNNLLGIDVSNYIFAEATLGFCVHSPDEGMARLPYATATPGLSFKHHELVETLRSIAAEEPGIKYLADARIRLLEENRLVLETKQKANYLTTALVIGADGKSAEFAQAAGLPVHSDAISSFAGILIKDVELPEEQFGHVLLGGPGPVLLYRINENEIRVGIDVPMHRKEWKRHPDLMLQAYRPYLPTEIAKAIHRAIQTDSVQWATTGFRSRQHYGKGNLRLVGDAVGFFHPLTACGITMAFADVEAAVQPTTFESYQQTRRARSYVPELLSNVLYRVFLGESESARSIRTAIFRNWQENIELKNTTMRLLAAEETNPHVFGAIFAQIGLDAMIKDVSGKLRRGQPIQALGSSRSFLQWADWPIAGALPWPIANALRRRTNPRSPFRQ